MTDYQENRQLMFIAVREFNTAYETELATLPNYSTLSEQFDAIVTEIQQISNKQKLDMTGFAAGKAEIKDTLTFQAADLSRKLVAFAKNTGNAGLKKLIEFTISDLRNSTDSALIAYCEEICARATEYQEDLDQYLVTVTMIEGLNELLDAFKDAIPKTKKTVKDRKLNTDRLKTLFEEGDTLLRDKMDAILEIVRVSAVPLYKAYRYARTVRNDYGAHKRAVTVKVTNTAGIPLSKVIASVAGSAATKKTTEKGTIHIDAMPAGTYSFKFSKNGYKPATATVYINDGETTKVDVVMENITENVSI